VDDKNHHQDSSQQRIGYMTTAGWDKLLDQVNQQIEELEQLPLPDVKEKVFTLLEGIDAIHREALGRLVSLFKKGVLEQVIEDRPIHTLMELYDLLPPEEDNEQKFDKNGFPLIPIQALAAMKKAPVPPPKYPRWIPMLEAHGALTPGSTKLMDIDGHMILLCRVGDEYFALAGSCEQDGASFDGAAISKYTLTCPNHTGCYYDVRQGTRIAASGTINCYPVEVSENDKDRVMIGLDMDFVPDLPVM
jgi:nitrite reductase/ring-hydroxylating ferredoxin subunit